MHALQRVETPLADDMHNGNVLRPLSRFLIGRWVCFGLSDTLGQDAETLGNRPFPCSCHCRFGPDHTRGHRWLRGPLSCAASLRLSFLLYPSESAAQPTARGGAGPTPRCRRLFLTRSARLRMMTQLRLPTSESAEAWGTSQSDMHSSRWSTGVSSPSPFSVRPGWPAPEPKVASDEYLLT